MVDRHAAIEDEMLFAESLQSVGLEWTRISGDYVLSYLAAKLLHLLMLLRVDGLSGVLALDFNNRSVATIGVDVAANDAVGLHSNSALHGDVLANTTAQGKGKVGSKDTKETTNVNELA